MYNEELATAILTRLREEFPDVMQFRRLYDFLHRDFPKVSEQEFLKSLDALLQMDRIRGVPLRSGSELVALANIAISPKIREELRSAQEKRKRELSSAAQTDDQENKILLRVTHRLLNLRVGTPVDQLRRNLGPRRTLIDSLLVKRFMRVVGSDYLPTFRGTECLDDDIRRIIRGNLSCVFMALQWLYRQALNHQTTFSFDAVVQAAQRIDPTRDANDVLPALLLGEEFSFYYFESGVHQNEERLSVEQITVHENIMDFTSVDVAWATTIARYEERRRQPMNAETTQDMTNLRKVFIVHGSDSAVKETTARLLEKLDLQAVILHEQPNLGLTLIEKFVLHSDVGFAVVLLTPDDVGGIRSAPPSPILSPRARQNVILELGYFIAKLGRERVCALYVEGVELPSDFLGVAYVLCDESGSWRLKLAREIKAAGIDVDLNRL